MKVINLNTGLNIRFTLFPDNQPHVNVQGVEEGEDVKVICSLTNSLKLLQLLETANALTHIKARKKILEIPYLMAARYDRLMLPGDSFDLEVIAGLINSCGFEKVYVWDAHSAATTTLIKNSASIKNKWLVEAYSHPDAVLICPDAGAAKKIKEYFDWNSSITDTVYCIKSRDLATGKLKLQVQDPGKCKDRNCVIIDDICDGGATFLAIADQVAPRHLSLIVTHGIFSKGFTALEQKFDEIIVSDSYCSTYDSRIVKCISMPVAV